MITPLDRMPADEPGARPDREFECTPEMFVSAYNSLEYVIGSRPKLAKNGNLVSGVYCFGDLHKVAAMLFDVCPPNWGTTSEWAVREWRNATAAVSLCLETPKTRKAVNKLFKEELNRK